jgi:putative transposase
MKCTFIDEHRAQWPVRLMGDVLGISTAAYYVARDRPVSARRQRRDELHQKIATIHQQVKARYGRPRIHAELLDQGETCCVNTVADVMKEHGIAAKTKKKYRCTTDSNHPYPVAANVLDRPFDPVTLNRVWSADITYLPTRDGWLYLAVVEDLCSRRIVGWSMNATMESRLVVDALEMAIQQRLPDAGLLAHSDRGSQ